MRLLTILLAFTLLMAELYQFFPSKVYLHFYPLAPGNDESIRWYVTALSDRVTWIITSAYLFTLLRKFKPQIAPYAFIFVLYRVLDIVAYILNGSIAGKLYLIVYIPIIIYGTYIIFVKQIWKAAEWTYSKIKKDGNNR